MTPCNDGSKLPNDGLVLGPVFGRHGLCPNIPLVLQSSSGGPSTGNSVAPVDGGTAFGCGPLRYNLKEQLKTSYEHIYSERITCCSQGTSDSCNVEAMSSTIPS